MPKSHDQPDNAQRISRLGLGKMLAYRYLDTPKLEQTLQSLVSSEDIRTACLVHKDLVGGEEARNQLLDWIEVKIASGSTDRI